MSIMITNMLKQLSMVKLDENSMVTISGLSGVYLLMLLVVLQVVHQLARQKAFSLETLDLKLKHGPFKNYSSHAEQLLIVQLVWVKTVNQKDMLTSISIVTKLLFKPSN